MCDLLHTHSVRNSNKILHSEEDKRKFFTGSTTLAAMAKMLATRMLTSDLFVVANIPDFKHLQA